MKSGIVYDESNLQSNRVSGDILKKVQQTVLRDMKEAVIPSMGPAGSNTLLLTGNNSDTLLAEYSKDGKKIISHVKYADPIEMSIQTEIADLCRHIEKTVGDGTSSAVALSSIIFDHLMEHALRKENPFHLARSFQRAVDEIKKEIDRNKRDCTIGDIYNIALISTNGNTDVADDLKEIYSEFGMNVFVDVAASLNEHSYRKKHDGLTLEVGYSDPAYINTSEGVSRLVNPRIYAFQDPIDVPQMVAYFEKIALTNCMEHIKDPENAIPTIIMAPSISRDMVGLMKQIVEFMYNFRPEMYTQKPPFLVITNIYGINQNHYEHITKLCGCKMIRKYIDGEIEKHDQETGTAPTLDNITEWYGTAKQVDCTDSTTLFYAPDRMYEKDENNEILYDGDGEDAMPVLSLTYQNLMNFLTTELSRAEAEATEYGKIGSLRRQINALKANMVEYFVGGITISDRDSLRDLVEDAVLNCRSAAKYGVGYGANFEALRAVDQIIRNDGIIYHSGKIFYDMIKDAYEELSVMLYSTVVDKEIAENLVKESLTNHYCPCNISTMEFDHKVLSSIASDTTILDTISKIISNMVVANQAIVQSPHINNYR